MTTLGYVLISIVIFLFIVVGFIFALGLCRMADDDYDEPYSCNCGMTDEEIKEEEEK